MKIQQSDIGDSIMSTYSEKEIDKRLEKLKAEIEWLELEKEYYTYKKEKIPLVNQLQQIFGSKKHNK